MIETNLLMIEILDRIATLDCKGNLRKVVLSMILNLFITSSHYAIYLLR